MEYGSHKNKEGYNSKKNRYKTKFSISLAV